MMGCFHIHGFNAVISLHILKSKSSKSSPQALPVFRGMWVHPFPESEVGSFFMQIQAGKLRRACRVAKARAPRSSGLTGAEPYKTGQRQGAGWQKHRSVFLSALQQVFKGIHGIHFLACKASPKAAKRQLPWERV